MNSHASQSKAHLRVVKLGGSLLSDQETPQRIERWLESESALQVSGDLSSMRNVWIVGGGELVNTVRDWDAKFSLEPESLHWLCVDLMDLNSRLLSAWFPAWPIWDQQQGVPGQSNQIFLTRDWLSQHENRLPKSWATTSDSIAAAFADFVDAAELVLLKSCPAPDELSLEGLAASDFVDDQFVPQVRSFRNRRNIRFVDLSDDGFNEASLIAP